jgi:hypothetical protein
MTIRTHRHAIINGRRVQVIPDGGIQGTDLLRELKPGHGRRGVFIAVFSCVAYAAVE